MEPTKVWSAGDEILSADLNNNFTEALNDYRDVTLGENITAPCPVYLKASDGKVYKTLSSSNDEKIHSFVGFLMATGVTNDVKKCQVSGKVAGLSGMTAGNKIYLKDSAGTYGGTVGTYEKIIGIAMSSTELLLRVSSEGALTQLAQIITGIKTFASFPVTPSSDPSNPYEVANKQYADKKEGQIASVSGANLDGAGHQVTKDSIVFGYAGRGFDGGASATTCICYSDSASTPTTVVQQFVGTAAQASHYGNFCFFVKAGDYYKITGASAGYIISFT